MVAAGGYVSPVIETARVVNVNIEDWTLNAVSEHANKQFFDITTMMPYFHYMNGEGIYAVPEVGAICWICQPSDGYNARPFILGFQAPHDEENESFRCGRQSYNPGDIVIRTRDENFVIVRRGGVVQLGATPTCQRMYIPIQNVIRDFCENYELNTFGGELIWETLRDENTTTGDALTKFNILAKEMADNDGHIATLTIGSHGEGNPVTMELIIYNQGVLEGREQMIRMTATKEGDVSWLVEKDWDVHARGEIRQHAEGDFLVSTDKNYKLESGENTELTVGADYNVEVSGDSKLKASSHVVDSTNIKWGSAGASEPGILGNKLVDVLNEICDTISALTYLDTTVSGPVGPAPVIGVSGISGPQGKISGILAQKVKLE